MDCVTLLCNVVFDIPKWKLSLGGGGRRENGQTILAQQIYVPNALPEWALSFLLYPTKINKHPSISSFNGHSEYRFWYFDKPSHIRNRIGSTLRKHRKSEKWKQKSFKNSFLCNPHLEGGVRGQTSLSPWKKTSQSPPGSAATKQFYNVQTWDKSEKRRPLWGNDVTDSKVRATDQVKPPEG